MLIMLLKVGTLLVLPWWLTLFVLPKYSIHRQGLG